MLFDSLLTAAKTQNTVTIGPDWGQGRTLFGGLTAALAFSKIRQGVDSERSLRSLSVNFSGQSLSDTPFTIHEQQLSGGKSISQVNGQIIQNDRIVTQVCACFGLARASEINVDFPKAELPKLGTHQKLGYFKGLSPEFVQYFEFEYCQGQLPFTNSPQNELAGWVRFKDEGSAFTEEHLIALIDAWPPTVIQKLKRFSPCATVSWNLEITQPLSLLENELQPGEWIYYDSTIKQAHQGYAHSEAKVYRADGTLLALSRQLVAVYD